MKTPGKLTREWFVALDDGLRMIGRGEPDATSAILAADQLAPWPRVSGRLVVRSDRSEGGAKVGDGAGRIAATREDGRWSGPDVVAGSGYRVSPALEHAHALRYNHPETKKSPAQLRREIAEALSPPSRRR